MFCLIRLLIVFWVLGRVGIGRVLRLVCSSIMHWSALLTLLHLSLFLLSLSLSLAHSIYLLHFLYIHISLSFSYPFIKMDIEHKGLDFVSAQGPITPRNGVQINLPIYFTKYPPICFFLIKSANFF